MLKNIDGLARLHKKRVEQAGFLVLKSPDIPSLLIEAGFISNPREAKLLSSNTYQQNMAKAIYRGMVQYYLDNPPPGTSLAVNKTERLKTHIVLKGDTLSQIAQKYRTSVDNLLRYNNLSSKQIKVGQRISLPSSK